MTPPPSNWRKHSRYASTLPTAIQTQSHIRYPQLHNDGTPPSKLHNKLTVPWADPIESHDEHGQPWATGYHPNVTLYPDSPHQLMNQPPLTPTQPTPSTPANVHSFPLSLRTPKQTQRIRVQHILEEYMFLLPSNC